jgi:hypothetical protein
MSSEEQIKKLIPAEIFMISGSGDSQTSADVHNVGQVRFISFSRSNPLARTCHTDATCIENGRRMM